MKIQEINFKEIATCHERKPHDNITSQLLNAISHKLTPLLPRVFLPAANFLPRVFRPAANFIG